MPILDNETFQQFKYHPTDVTPGMAKKVVCRCDQCPTVYIIRRKNIHGETTLCRSCAFKAIPRENYARGVAKRKQTCMDRYGVTQKPFEPSAAETRKKTNLERYGASTPMGSHAIQEKAKATNLARYGIPYVVAAPATRKKSRATMLERYGVEHTLQSPELYAKAVATWVKNHGVKNPGLAAAVRAKIIKTTLERYGTLTPSGYGAAEKHLIASMPPSIAISDKPYILPSGQSIDVYMPEKNFGIEYGGLHFHHEHSWTPRRRYYHHTKMLEANKIGIHLITLFEDEWLLRNHQVKAVLYAKLGVFERIIGARDCTISPADTVEAMTFIEQNHILETPKTILRAWKLTDHESRIVAMLTVRHDYQKHGNAITLNRLCFAQGVRIMGGAARLLSAATAWARTQNIKYIMSWSDNRWSQGSLYKTLGFQLDRDGGPDYTYVNIDKPRNRIPKKSRQKRRIGCPQGPNTVTEYEWNLALGYARLWDCGHRRWKLSL